MSATAVSPFEQKVGHPPGLFVLFFAEMWERFSYYGMRALLVFYMTKGFLGYDDALAYETYGAYAGLVYMTPFIGGMVADRLIGPRLAVIVGAMLMAAGQLMMTVENELAFFAALSLLIAGNGLFKPNISTMIGNLYPDEARKDAGFTIFYMGINLGAALAPLLCGYVGETYGWRYGFGLAAGGMLVGLTIFVLPSRILQAIIGLGALATGGALVSTVLDKSWLFWLVNFPVAIALVIAAFVAVWALNHGAIPATIGAPPTTNRLKQKLAFVVLGACLVLPLAGLLLRHHLAGPMLGIFGIGAFGFILVEALRSHKIVRERLFVVLVLSFFSTLFWAFFEQAGSSMNNFADRNVDRIITAERVITAADVGQTLAINVSQAQLGYENGGKAFTLDQLDDLRVKAQTDKAGGGAGDAVKVAWTFTAQNVGMVVNGQEVPASQFQAANPFFILFLGLLFSAMWTFLGRHKLEPSTPVKFSLGLLQLSLGFVVLWWSSTHCDGRGMVGMTWLLLTYLLHTTGELCLSPIGLSMITKLSPRHLVATTMGAWFLATAFSEYLAGLIATLTGVHEGGEEKSIPVPLDTVHVYGDVFGKIAIAAAVAFVLLLLLSPVLKKWMHPNEEAPAAGH